MTEAHTRKEVIETIYQLKAPTTGTNGNKLRNKKTIRNSVDRYSRTLQTFKDSFCPICNRTFLEVIGRGIDDVRILEIRKRLHMKVCKGKIFFHSFS